jgi:hypothetical protein
VDRFRTEKETARAHYIAASATRDIQLTLLETATAATPDELGQARAELSDAEADMAATSAQVTATLGSGARLLRKLGRELRAGEPAETSSSPGDAAASEPPVADAEDGEGVTAGLLELRVDPLATDIRILCAAEPSDTVTLLAAVEGTDAVAEHRDDAIKLAGDLLEELRAGGWPRTDVTEDAGTFPVTFSDTGAFLARYFPSSAAAVSDRATELAAATTLAALRRQRGVSLDDLAQRSGLAATRLRWLEDDRLRCAELGDVAAYVRALGGRLALAADLGDGQPRPLF